ncbi:MAG: succinylglutamate desuccinylase/aspartoacylase family protein [Limisphaerales bacterium]
MPLESRKFSGPESGPHLLITAGVHGDEYVPMQAVRELIIILEQEELLRGSVTLVPVANESAFSLGRRCGEDGLDLARTCPGKPDGSVTEQVAYALTELINEADYFVDLHSGGTELSVFPLAGYMLHPDAEILDSQRRLAKAFNLPLVWGTSADLDGRSLSAARDAKVPAIYVEYLGGVEPCPEGIEACLDGCLNVMGALELIDRVHDGVDVVEIIEDKRPNAGFMQICNPAPINGFFQPAVSLGQDVKAGDVLGHVCSVTGEDSYEMKSDLTGKVVVLRNVPRVSQGESIGVVAERGRGL